MLQATEFKKANKDELRSVFQYLEFCLEQVVKDNELGALEQALKVRHRLLLPALDTPLLYAVQGADLLTLMTHCSHFCMLSRPVMIVECACILLVRCQ